MEKCRHNVHRLYGVLAYTSRFTWDKTATAFYFYLLPRSYIAISVIIFIALWRGSTTSQL